MKWNQIKTLHESTSSNCWQFVSLQKQYKSWFKRGISHDEWNTGERPRPAWINFLVITNKKRITSNSQQIPEQSLGRKSCNFFISIYLTLAFFAHYVGTKLMFPAFSSVRLTLDTMETIPYFGHLRLSLSLNSNQLKSLFTRDHFSRFRWILN